MEHMERPSGVPEEFWHNDPPEVCLATMEEMAKFWWEMGVRHDEEEERLPPNWRASIEAMMKGERP